MCWPRSSSPLRARVPTWLCVVVRSLATGRTYMLTKGSDKAIYPFCDQATKKGKLVLKSVRKQATSFAELGSRTLVMAGKELTKDEFDAWVAVYNRCVCVCVCVCACV